MSACDYKVKKMSEKEQDLMIEMEMEKERVMNRAVSYVGLNQVHMIQLKKKNPFFIICRLNLSNLSSKPESSDRRKAG